MKKELHPTEKQELKKADQAFDDLVRRAKSKGALISLTQLQPSEKPSFKQHLFFNHKT